MELLSLSVVTDEWISLFSFFCLSPILLGMFPPLSQQPGKFFLFILQDLGKSDFLLWCCLFSSLQIPLAALVSTDLEFTADPHYISLYIPMLDPSRKATSSTKADAQSWAIWGSRWIILEI